MKREIKIALVGARFTANLHFGAYKSISDVDVKIVGIASKDSKNARAFCQRYGLDSKIVYDDAEEMIENVDANIIDLVIPTFLHIPFAVKAARAGKHVICEKPLTGYFGDLNVSIEERKNVGKWIKM